MTIKISEGKKGVHWICTEAIYFLNKMLETYQVMIYFPNQVLYINLDPSNALTEGWHKNKKKLVHSQNISAPFSGAADGISHP